MPFPGHQTNHGWGVYRDNPWHFYGLFGSKDEALKALATAGDAYLMGYGEHRNGSDDFIIKSAPDA